MSAELSLHGLSRDHANGGVPALSDLDLCVPAGSCTAILGPSGAGKSTVLRLASGLDEPDAGDVRLDGRSVRDLPAERRQTAMVFQRPLLFPHLSVLDNIAFSDRVAGVGRRAARRRAEEYLALVRLEGFGHRRAGELSGGQEQRVALARALAAQPKVLLLDEPFSALDAALRADMHDLLRHIRTVLAPTIVLVTHDHAEATALADRVAVLCEGRLQQYDTVDRLYARPASLTVARLMGGRNEVPGRVQGHRHRSVLGSVSLPVDQHRPDGPATLVVRQESIDLLDAGDRDAQVGGRVRAVTPSGARRRVRVDVPSPGPDAVTLEVEVPPGFPVSIGDEVGLHLHAHALAVVPAEDAAAPVTPLGRATSGTDPGASLERPS